MKAALDARPRPDRPFKAGDRVAYWRRRQGSGKRNACQFSYNCDGKLEIITEKDIYNRILKLSRLLLEPSARVLTDGATFFHAKAVSPSWAKKFKKTREIGQHIFYKIP